MITYNDSTTIHSTNLERPRTDVRVSGNLGLLNAELLLNLNGESTVSFDIRGTFVGTFVIEGTFDGANYISVSFYNPLTEAWATTATVAGQFNVPNIASYRAIRVRCSAFTSGSATVSLNASLGRTMIYTKPIPASLCVTNTGVTAAAVTLTLPAAGAGLYHYITRILVQRHTSTLLTAGSTPILVTTTNMPGARVFSFPADAALAGVVAQEIIEPSQPLKTTTANTATTIVCPATTGVIWRVTVDYYIAA